MSPVGSKYTRPDRHPAGRERGAARGAATRASRQAGRTDTLATGVDMVYGRNAVREALRGKRRVRSVTIAAQERESTPGDLDVAVRGWAEAAEVSVPPIARVAQEELSERLRTHDHQGIAAEVDPYPYVEAEQLLGTHSLVVALDRVQDPHNLGAVVRTAEAADAGVIIARHRAAQITASVVKASAGATEHADIAQVRNLGDVLGVAKRSGFWIYGAAAGADTAYTSQDYSYPTVFVLGSEGQGLGQRVEALCDMTVGLPLLGTVESLNVSVSAGILIYEALRQRRSD